MTTKTAKSKPTECWHSRGGLWGTLKFIGFILLPWDNPLMFGAVRWKRDKNLRILPLRRSEVFYGIRMTKELKQNCTVATKC